MAIACLTEVAQLKCTIFYNKYMYVFLTVFILLLYIITVSNTYTFFFFNFYFVGKIKLFYRSIRIYIKLTVMIITIFVSIWVKK